MGDPALFAAYLPLFLSTGALVTGATIWWGVLFPRLLPWLLSAGIIAGQVVRLPLPGQGGGIVLSDFIVSVVCSCLLLRIVNSLLKKEKLAKGIVIFLILPAFFLLWALYSLLIHSTVIPSGGMVIALAYWSRLTLYILLLPLLFYGSQSIPMFPRSLLNSLLWAAGLLALIGFIQLVFVSDLSVIAAAGWDPHQLRLVSTWLDPNLIGVFFIAAAGLAATQYVHTKRIIYAALTSTILVATLLTQSRSSFIAAISAWMAVVIWATGTMRVRSHRVMTMASANLFLFLLAILAGGLFPDRLLGLVTKDQTVTLRAEALQAVWHNLVEPNALTGVGYNAYQFIAQDAGVITDFAIHSRAGADNSLLTLWVTTGLIGLSLVGLLGTAVVQVIAWRALSGYAFALAAISAFASLAIHAQFVNSALYAHLIITFGIVGVLALAPPKPGNIQL